MFKHGYVLRQLIKRDVLLRYRGAYFGVAWIFLNPLIMLAIFTFVFGQIFQSRWLDQGSTLPFVLNVYCGLIVFNIFSETVSRSPNAVRGYPSYVKKIIFPVHLLPLVPLGSALFHAAFNVLLLLMALAWLSEVHVSLFALPVLLLPLLLFSVGLAWFLAAWGVFIKDMTQIVPVFVQMLLFLSPVFYPAQAVPPSLQWLYRFNPLGAVIEAVRAVASGQTVPWAAWGASLGVAAVACLVGYLFFQHSRDEFADVL